MVAVQSLVLTRGQIKALAYAKSLKESGQLDVLAESGNKTDALLARELMLQEKRAAARNNGNAIHRLIVNRYGSDGALRGVDCPANSKTVTLKAWAIDCEIAIKGKEDSTPKAIESRRAAFNARFGDLFLMVAELK